MKISKYTFLFEVCNKYYIYNTLSNALIEVEEGVYEILQTCKKNNSYVNKEELDDEELYCVLSEKRILTENNQNEFLLYKSLIQNDRSVCCLSLTIAPTLDCNYSCPYCFENNRNSIYMNTDVMDSIVSFINKQNIKQIHITWFGGEPLMGIEQIKQLCQKMTKLEDRSFSYSMITNGFLITPEIITFLKEMGLNSLQITVDGLKESHNLAKYTKNCKDTFSKTIENIDLLASSAPKIRVDVRANLNKKNANEYADLYDFFANRYKESPQIRIYPAFVTGSSTGCQRKESLLFTRKEKSKFVLDLYYNKGITTHLCRYPNSTFQECSTRNKNVYTIDPEGYFYKCWEVIGDKKYAIGKLNSDGFLGSINCNMLNRYLYGSDPLEDKTCSKCSYLPICFGGCPHKRIENEFEGKHNDTCTHLKGTLNEFIKIHLLNFKSIEL